MHLLLFAGIIVPLAGGCARPWHPLAQPVEAEEVIGTMQRHRITGDETLIDLTRRYDIGYVELVAANPGVDPWLPGTNTEVVIPTAHLAPSGTNQGIVVNLAEQRLYFFPKKRSPEDQSPPSYMDSLSPVSFPIGVSREGWETPLGKTRVVRKRAKPIWYPTASARREDATLPKAVGPGPENPLGEFALYLDWPTYLIHGTNEPDGVGRRVSRGCIRLYPEDIERLFKMAPINTPVEVIHQTVKLARAGRHVYLEVHPTIEEMARLEAEAQLEEIRPDDLRPQIRAFAGADADRIDWRLAYQTAAERRGIPVQITR